MEILKNTEAWCNKLTGGPIGNVVLYGTFRWADRGRSSLSVFLRSIKKELYADCEQAYIFLLRLFSTDKDCKKGVYQVFALKRYACIALRTGLFKKTMHAALGTINRLWFRIKEWGMLLIIHWEENCRIVRIAKNPFCASVGYCWAPEHKIIERMVTIINAVQERFSSLFNNVFLECAFPFARYRACIPAV